MVCTLRRKGGGALGHCSLTLAPTEAGRARKATASSWVVGGIQGLQELPGGRMESSSGAERMETGPFRARRVAPLC